MRMGNLQITTLFLIISFSISSRINNNNLVWRCRSEGRYADPKDCGSFYECLQDGGKDFIIRRGSCKGYAFEPNLGKCVEPSLVPGCKLRRGKVIDSDLELQRLCEDRNVSFACGSCGKLVLCAVGFAYSHDCTGGTYCEKDTTNFNGAVCRSSFSTCSCATSNSFVKDVHSPSHFGYCNSLGIREVYRCPQGKVFNETKVTCEDESGLPSCYQMGTFANHLNCSVYYTCVPTESGWLQYVFRCPKFLYYNNKSGKCEDPCDFIVAAKPPCQEPGRFKNPFNCQHFIECIQNGKGSFHQIERSCPSGHEWDDGKHFCLPKRDSSCEMIESSACKLPERCSVSKSGSSTH